MSSRPIRPGVIQAQRSDCPIACGLEVIGDRWTLLIVRDLFLGKRRFSEFLESSEGIPTNILADRLKRLEGAGLAERVKYLAHPPRYEYRLTQAGHGLSPVLGAIFTWGQAHSRARGVSTKPVPLPPERRRGTGENRSRPKARS